MVQFPPPPPPPFLPPNEKTRKESGSQQVKIEVALVGTFLIYTMILILGHLRSRGGSMIKQISTKSFMVTAYLVSFVPGLMTAPSLSSHLYVFWIAFMAYLAAVTNEISCYTLGDNEDRKKRLIVDYVVVWPLVLTFLYKSLTDPEILVPIVIIFWVVVLKLRERSRALLYATNSSNGIARATKIISDFNEYKQVEANHVSNSSTSPYKNFLVGVREAQKISVEQSKTGFKLIDFDDSNPKIITLDKVLDTNDSFLVSTDAGKERQDTCTSFAMFFSLLAIMAGYDNVDARLFKEGNKLPPNSFALVEKELGFLYDYLYTNYYAIYQRGFWKKIRDLCVICLFFWLTIPLLVEYRPQDHNAVYVILWKRVVDTGFNRFVILAILAIEFTQIGIFMTSKWAKVTYTCTYLRNLSLKRNNFLQRMVIRIACLIPRPRLSHFCLSTLTKRKISQYSILKCFDEIPHPMWLKCWIGSYYDLPRMGQGGKWTEEVSSELQGSILKSIDTFRSKHNGQVTNGVCSLETNEVGEDIINTYVKKPRRQARVILTWHIATSLLEENEPKTKASSSNEVSVDFQVATLVSNYIAYLVAFFPQMLPYHVYTTQCEFDEAVKQLKAEMTENDEDEENQGEGLNNGANSILKEARELKKQLEEQPNLWRTLADFWVETLLFLALSDHSKAIEAHANSLCIGGEFITHLWALLTHAGCSRKKAIR